MEFSDVIYDLIDDVNARLAQHGPQTVTTVVGQATVLKVFKLSGKLKGTVIAGVRLDHGRIADGGIIRVMRQAPLDEGGEGEGAEEEHEPVTVGHGKVATLHHHQSTVRLAPLASPRQLAHRALSGRADYRDGGRRRRVRRLPRRDLHGLRGGRPAADDGGAAAAGRGRRRVIK